MARNGSLDARSYAVVVSDDAGYSIWPASAPLPNGWRPAGRSGTKAECLAYVNALRAEASPLRVEPDPPAFVQPVTPTEQLTCDAVAEVLGVGAVGLDDNFFTRGGTSLLAIRLLEKLRAVGLEASPKDVFEVSDLREMARRLRPVQKLHEAPPNRIPPGAERIVPEMLTLVELDQDQIDEIAALVPGGARNIQDIYPLTPLQEGFVFEHLSADVDPYVTSLVLHLDSEPDLARFMRGLEQFVARHDILRTAVLWDVRPRPVQVVLRSASLAIERRDRIMTDDDLLAVGQAQASGFDLVRPPLARATAAPSSEGGWSFLLVIHHVVDDDMLLRNLVHELAAVAQGRTLPPPVQFRNFVSYISTRDPKTSEPFWRQQLEGISRPTSPIRVRGAQLTSHERLLSRELSDRIRGTSRACAVVPAALLHLAYAIVLARRTATSDVVFGTVLSGRSAPVAGLESAAGMFLSTLPVRTRLDRGTVREALARMHVLLAELPAHVHVPLPLIQRWSSIRPPAPLFEALLNTRHATDDGRNRLFRGDFGVRDSRGGQRTHYPFAVSINDFAEGYHLGVQTIAHDGDDVLRMLEDVLASIVADVEQPITAVLSPTARQADPERPIDEQPLISMDERRELLEAGTGAATELPRGSITEIFESVVARDPDAIAVVRASDAPSLTYAELNRRANQLARHLRCHAPRLERVAIAMDRSLDSLVATLAVLKLGAAYVPLDPHGPSDRLRFVVEDIDPDLILTAGDAVAPSGRRTLDVRSSRDAIAAQDGANLGGRAGEEDVAYIMYTSGSTGRPKGVCVAHRGVVRLVCNTSYLAVAAGDRFTHLSPPTFDASTLEIWGPLLNGATMVLVEGQQPSLDVLADAIAGHGATTVWLTTGLFKLMVDHRLDALAHVRVLITGGDVAPQAQVKKVLAALPSCTVINGYGPTENTTFSTTFRVPADHPCEGPLPIGTPIANSSVFVLDAHGELVPRGVIGELYVGGAGVARGYWNRPELTAERFITLPGLGDGLLYRTGDLARWREDGELDFLGRVDHQVKIRGFRVEPAEIEAILTADARVRDAVVVAQRDAAQEARLVAYCVVDDDVAPADLRAIGEQHLPEYMIPAFFVTLPALPLLPSGKLDRAALPSPDVARPLGEATYVPPCSPVEETLVAIWREVLRVERVGCCDRFSDLGGHSLHAMRVAARVRKELGVAITLRDLLARPTIRQLAELFPHARTRRGTRDARNGHAAHTSVIPLKPTGDRPPIFFVPGAFGSVGYLMPLAGALSEDRPLYAFQAPGLDGGEPLDSIADMADHYWQALRTVQPAGPYVLAGHSFGATVAFALARRIIENGGSVDHLFLVDGLAPALSSSPSEPDRTQMLTEFTSAFAAVLGADAGLAARELQGMSDRDALELVRRRLQSAGLADLDSDTLQRFLAVFGANMRAAHGLQDGPLAVPATLVTALEATDPRQLRDRSYGWDAWLTSDFEVVPTPGNHFSMLRAPFVDTLASKLEERIRGQLSNIAGARP